MLVIDRTFAVVDEVNFAEEVVPIEEASRLWVGLFDCGSVVGSSGSWLIESSGSEGSMFLGSGGLLLLGSGGLSLLLGGPFELLLLQILRPTVAKNFVSRPPKLVGGLSHVGKSDSMFIGFPSRNQTKPGGRNIVEHSESVGRPPWPVEVQVLVTVLDVLTLVVRTCDQISTVPLADSVVVMGLVTIGIEVPFAETPDIFVMFPMLLLVVLLVEIDDNDAAVIAAEVDPERLFGAVRDRVIVEGLLFNQRYMVPQPGEINYRATGPIASPI